MIAARKPAWRLALAVCAAVAVNLPATVHAADQSGNYAIWGAGQDSCYRFSKADEDEAAGQRYRHYLMGYLTAVSMVTPEVYNAVGERSFDDLMRWLQTYCKAHQMDGFERAIKQLLDDSATQRQALAPGHDRPWGRAGTVEPGSE